MDNVINSWARNNNMVPSHPQPPDKDILASKFTQVDVDKMCISLISLMPNISSALYDRYAKHTDRVMEIWLIRDSVHSNKFSHFYLTYPQFFAIYPRINTITTRNDQQLFDMWSTEFSNQVEYWSHSNWQRQAGRNRLKCRIIYHRCESFAFIVARYNIKR